MIAAVIAEGVMLIVLIVVLFLRLRAYDEAIASARADHFEQQKLWTEERRELLNRVQAPHVIPVRKGEGPKAQPKPHEANLSVIGRVSKPQEMPDAG